MRDPFLGCLLGLACGDAVGTTGAVCGQIAGAFYGKSQIPEEWGERLAMRERIEGLAEKLYERQPENSGSAV